MIEYFKSIIPVGLEAYFYNIFLVLPIVLIGWWFINRISRLSAVFLRKASVDESITSFLNSLIKFFLKIILLVMALSILGVNVNSIVTALGASLVAIGISLKESLSNVVSGIVLVVNKPIHVGDFIEFDGFSGTVIKIEMLFTTLKTAEEGKTVIIPNVKLVSNTVVRKSEYDLSKSEFNYKISFNKLNKESVRKFLEKEFLLSGSVLQIPSPEVVFEKVSEGKGELKIVVWSQSRYKEKTNAEIEKAVAKLPAKFGLKTELKESDV